MQGGKSAAPGMRTQRSVRHARVVNHREAATLGSNVVLHRAITMLSRAQADVAGFTRFATRAQDSSPLPSEDQR